MASGSPIGRFVRRYGFIVVAAAVFVCAAVLGGGSAWRALGGFVHGLAGGGPESSRGPAVHLALAPAPASTRMHPPAVPSGPAHRAPPRPAIAICIDDLGANVPATERAIELPKQVALSFFPFAAATPRLARAAERAGHTVLAHVPMQALGPVAPSPMTLTLGSPDIATRLEWNIDRVPGLAGINNHQGSRFTQDAASLVPVVRILAARHLFFFDSRTIAGTQVVAVARRHGVLSAGRDVFLDDVQTRAAVRTQLDKLVAVALRKGVAIAIGHPHDATLAVLAAWLAGDHGVALVSLPVALRMKEDRARRGG